MKFTQMVAYNFNRGMDAVKKASPEIMLVAGLAVGAGAIVSACIATRKAEPIIEQTKADVDVAHAKIDDASDEDAEKIAKNELVATYRHAGVQLAKIYLPTVGLALGAAGLIIGSNHIHRERYAGVAAAYTSLDAAYQAYRENVKKRFGDTTDSELAQGISYVEQDGVIAKQQDAQAVADPRAVLYDEASREWSDTPGLNRSFLMNKEEEINRRFERRAFSMVSGTIFMTLYEAYDLIGISADTPEIARQWQHWGWEWKIGQDNHISLGFENSPSFMDGSEKSVWLSPNARPII